MHQMLASMTGVAEFELDTDEAKKLGRGIQNVARHYDIPATQKTIDWTNLAMIVAGVYGTRIMAYRMRVAATRNARDKIRSIHPDTTRPENIQ